MALVHQWKPNELFLEHNGVKIYHVYKDDDNESGVRIYMFGLDEYGSDNGDDMSDHIVFDVRSLDAYRHNRKIKDVLCEAIDTGDITQNCVKLRL